MIGFWVKSETGRTKLLKLFDRFIVFRLNIECYICCTKMLKNSPVRSRLYNLYNLVRYVIAKKQNNFSVWHKHTLFALATLFDDFSYKINFAPLFWQLEFALYCHSNDTPNNHYLFTSPCRCSLLIVNQLLVLFKHAHIIINMERPSCYTIHTIFMENC